MRRGRSKKHQLKQGKTMMGQTTIPWGMDDNDRKAASEIFVVDDDENVRDLLEAALAPVGFPVSSFEDGDSFLKAASTRVPICVFLDVVMPRRSGLEVLKELQARHFWTPVFLISAREDSSMIVEGMKSGAHNYIRKPIDENAPVSLVHDAIEVWSRRDQERRALDFQPDESGEWFRLSASERETIALMRLMKF